MNITLLARDGSVAATVRIPDSGVVPDVVVWRGRYFALRQGVYSETTPFVVSED